MKVQIAEFFAVSICILAILGHFAFWIGLIYIALHFIMKFW